MKTFAVIILLGMAVSSGALAGGKSGPQEGAAKESTSHLEALPVEMLEKIFGFLDTQSLGRVAAVSSQCQYGASNRLEHERQEYVYLKEHASALDNGQMDYGKMIEIFSNATFPRSAQRLIAEIESRGFSKEFAVIAAAMVGNVTLLRMMHQNEFPFSVEGSLVGTPAHFAAGNGQVKTLKFLAEYYPELFTVNAAGSTPIGIAKRNPAISAEWSSIEEILLRSIELRNANQNNNNNN